MDYSYCYTLTEANDVCHFVLSNENEFGMQNTILRNVGTELPEPYRIHSQIVNRLFTENEPRDVVFMQVALPGKAFEPYNKERQKMPITLKAYVELLKFFATDYPLVFKRIEADTQVMAVGKQWLSQTPSITFTGPANISCKKTLVREAQYSLDIWIERRHDLGKRCATLRYSNEDLGVLYVHPQALLFLAQELDIISGLQNYKGVSMAKKSRQS